MSTYGFHQLPVGTKFTIATEGGVIKLTSRGRGTKWLDVSIKDGDGMLLCFFEPYDGDYEAFIDELAKRGGPVNAAATEIRAGMTAGVMLEGGTYPFVVDGVSID